MTRDTGAVLLAIETSGRTGGAALVRLDDGCTGILAEGALHDERPFTADLFPMLARILRDAGLTVADVGVFAYSCGPGSFTGLRVAATTARMMQSAIGCGVVAVPTLEAIAWNAMPDLKAGERIAPILNAGRGQIYGALYVADPHAARLRAEVAPAVRVPAAWLQSLQRPFTIIGDGISRHREACERVATGTGVTIASAERWTPTAAGVAVLAAQRVRDGKLCPPEQILPLYLRPPACEEVYEERRAAARARRGE